MAQIFNVVVDGAAPSWAQRLAIDLNDALGRLSSSIPAPTVVPDVDAAIAAAIAAAFAPADPRYLLLGRTAYTGQLATRVRVPDSISLPNKQCMARTAHFAREDIKSIQLVSPNFYVTANVETAPGASAQIQASIEYPVNSFQQLTWPGGSVGGFQGTIPNGGYLVSNATQVDIPRGAEFWVRTYWTNTAGMVFSANAGDQPHGEAFQYGASGIPNAVNGGTITDSVGTGATTHMLLPCGIIGTTTNSSFAMLGDSRAWGFGDTFSDTSRTLGGIERGLGGLAALMNLSESGDSAQAFIASHTNRLALAQYCSHIICQYGINDLAIGRTSTQLLADLATIRGYFSGKTFIEATLEPVSSSTDAWATTTNQTTAAYNAQRVAVNTAIRNGTVSDRFIDVASAVESSLNSGVWSPSRTADGVHPNYAGALLIKFLQVANRTTLSA